jgi:hypothetical protein
VRGDQEEKTYASVLELLFMREPVVHQNTGSLWFSFQEKAQQKLSNGISMLLEKQETHHIDLCCLLESSNEKWGC